MKYLTDMLPIPLQDNLHFPPGIGPIYARYYDSHACHPTTSQNQTREPSEATEKVVALRNGHGLSIYSK